MLGRKIRIVLDTNVLYAGLYSSKGASFRVLQAIEKGKIRMVISTTLLFEKECIINEEVINNREKPMLLYEKQAELA